MDLPFLCPPVDASICAKSVSILILMDLPFLSERLIIEPVRLRCFNPYSNGSSFFILCLLHLLLCIQCVSILILMDLPFLYISVYNEQIEGESFNPYSNGSSFFMSISRTIISQFFWFQSLF